MKRAVYNIGVLAVLSLFAYFLYINIRHVAWQQVHLRPGFLILSLVLLQASFLFNIVAMQRAYLLLKVPLSFRGGYSIYFLSNLGRYLPGRVWQFVVMTFIARKHGVPVKESSSILVLNQLTAIATGLLCVLGHGLMIKSLPQGLRLYSLIALSPMIGIFFFPNVIIYALNMLLRAFGRSAIQVRVPYRYVLFLLGCYAISFTLTGLGFICLVRALGYIIDDFSLFIAVYPLAYIIGYLALITPGGIGVRESVIIVILKSKFDAPTASLIALASLVWMVGLEFANSICFFLLNPDLRNSQIWKPSGRVETMPQDSRGDVAAEARGTECNQ